ncbi:hypothetical protein HDU98_003494 [Podochytrium sp. JEL0797]|nr:hypothetical protein HDU98_003494 [Podochytrium sp. JEL0797]
MQKHKRPRDSDPASDSPNGSNPKTIKKTKAPVVDPDQAIEPEYSFDAEHGLRKVAPYWFTHKTMAKGRWWKRTLLDVFTTEFQDKSPEYYRKAILAGKINVNHTTKPLDYILQNGDLVCHRTHRHEPPVGDHKIKIVFQDADLLIVDKPPSIPVHPSGRYTHNTVLGILKSKEYGFENLFSVNRIDRLTSGILLIALTKKKANQLATELREREVSKTYLCRVRGKFPEGTTPCLEPILIMSNKLGINIVHPTGRPCETHFTFLSYNPTTDTSVVQCAPKTGRTHQLRVHLQYLGFPIANDPLYCNEALWGPGMGKGGVVDSEEVLERIKEAKVVGDLGVDWVDEEQVPEAAQEEVGDEFACLECLVVRKEPMKSQLKIYLHSWKYSGEGWAYETEMPEWAAADFVE